MKTTTNFTANMFRHDFQAMLALSYARKRENAVRRAACQANADLCAWMLADARRRGLGAVDWQAYFQNAGIA